MQGHAAFADIQRLGLVAGGPDALDQESGRERAIATGARFHEGADGAETGFGAFDSQRLVKNEMGAHVETAFKADLRLDEHNGKGALVDGSGFGGAQDVAGILRVGTVNDDGFKALAGDLADDVVGGGEMLEDRFRGRSGRGLRLELSYRRNSAIKISDSLGGTLTFMAARGHANHGFLPATPRKTAGGKSHRGRSRTATCLHCKCMEFCGQRWVLARRYASHRGRSIRTISGRQGERLPWALNGSGPRSGGGARPIPPAGCKSLCTKGMNRVVAMALFFY